jgi:hypothetical protein
MVPEVAHTPCQLVALPESAAWPLGNTATQKFLNDSVFDFGRRLANVIPAAWRQACEFASHTHGHVFNLDQLAYRLTLLVKAQNFFASSTSMPWARLRQPP